MERIKPLAVLAPSERSNKRHCPFGLFSARWRVVEAEAAVSGMSGRRAILWFARVGGNSLRAKEALTSNQSSVADAWSCCRRMAYSFDSVRRRQTLRFFGTGELTCRQFGLVQNKCLMVCNGQDLILVCPSKEGKGTRFPARPAA